MTTPDTTIIAPDPAALGARAADWLVERIAATPGRFALALSGGSTPLALFRELARPERASRVDWSRVHLFWCDERCVPHTDPASNYGAARAALIDQLPIPPANAHAVRDDLAPVEAAADYASRLQAFYGARELDPARPLFDVVLLGVGEDGHTASLFPGAPQLGERTAWAVAAEGQRPEPRVSLTLPVLGSARAVAFLVAGEAKREVVARVRAGDAALPAARVQPVGERVWLLDRAAVGDDGPHAPDGRCPPRGLSALGTARRADDGPHAPDGRCPPRGLSALGTARQAGRVKPVVIVMGVTASGKTTLARTLAERLGWPFQEGDDLHPPANIEKLSAGEPLTDEERAPWLAAIGRWIDARTAAGGGGTVSCSALRRRYRDRLREGRPAVCFVLLDGSAEALAERLAHREGHFMSPRLLENQLATLEMPTPDEAALVLSIDLPLEEKCAAVEAWLVQRAGV